MIEILGQPFSPEAEWYAPIQAIDEHEARAMAPELVEHIVDVATAVSRGSRERRRPQLEESAKRAADLARQRGETVVRGISDSILRPKK